MSSDSRLSALARRPLVRCALVALGFLLIALAPLLGPLPGPGGIILFAAGLTIVLRYSEWAKRQYVKFKKKHPKKAAWTDWGLRRKSHLRREAIRKERETAEATAPAEAPIDMEKQPEVETAELHVGTLEGREASSDGVRN